MKILLTALILLGTLAAGLANASDSANVDDKVLARDANAALAQKDYKTAFAKFSALAELGKPAAQFNLGAFYLNGQGVQKDDRLAYEWFRKSAVLGNDRALKVIESAAKQGNVNAINELKVIKGLSEPAVVQIQPQEKPQEKPKAKPQEIVQEKPAEKVQEKPQPHDNNSARHYRLANSDPTVAAAGKWVTGISVEYAKFKSTEPLYYPVSGVLNSASQSYSVSQPGVSAWVGQGDITVTASFRKRSGNVASTVSGVGSLSKTFEAKETEFDVRWMLSQYSSTHFVPFVSAGLVLNSASGTGNEIDFQDIYSQKDTILMVGAGAIIPLDEKIGFRIEGAMGSDRQKSSGTYVPATGVTLSFASYSYSASATYSRIAASMYYKISGGWNAQMGLRRGNYAAGIGPAFNDTAISVMAGYAYR